MKAESPATAAPTLDRALGLPLFVAYGVGTMVGAGYYALLGEVAGRAGMLTPLAFLVAGVVAALSAVSFGALGARFPTSAGEARYVEEGFRSPRLGTLVGWLVIATGVVSAATLAGAFARFLADLVVVERAVAVTVMTLAIGGVAAWGIRASTVVTVGITVAEVGGLLWVMALRGHHLAELPSRLGEVAWPSGEVFLIAVLPAAFLGFYAFVGFEDMVNLAEEVEDPRRVLPRGLVISLAITLALYVVTATCAVLAVDPAELAAARTPMAVLVGERGGVSATVVTCISIVTGVNGALVQVVMAARVLLGLARRGGAPRAFAAIHPERRTPLRATLGVTAAVLALALGFGLVALAEWTSAIILVVFTFVHLSLARILVRERQGPKVPAPSPPLWVPLAGAGLCVAFLGFALA